MKIYFFNCGGYYNYLIAKMTIFKAYSVRSDTITNAKGSILQLWLNFM